jgi:hypothetical protein
MGGVGLFSAFGTELGRYFTIGGFGELLFDTAKYGVTSTASPQPTVNTSDFIAGPEMRFRTPTQPIRFFAALGPLLDVRWAAANQPTMSGATLTTSGAGAGLGLQAEAGLDASISPAYIHAGFYLVAHDISSVKDNTGARLFDQTGSVQAGLRAMIGLPF